MSDTITSKMPFRVANIVVTPQLNTIDNERIEHKAMQLLCFLVQRQGQVCSKQDILDAIWPRQIVADDAVTRLIFVLRSALGDSAKSPVFISTVPKKGYVFLVKPEPISSFNKKKLIVIAGATLFLAVLLIGYNFLIPKKTNTYQVARTLPVTHQEGLEYSYALGENFSGYFHEYENSTQLILKKEGHADQVLIKDHWQKRSLLITNDLIFYARFTDNHYQIIQQALDGTANVLFESNTPIYSLSANNDGQGLLFNHYQNNNSTVLYSYSLQEKNVSPYVVSNLSLPKIIYSHFYHRAQNLLFFIGVEGRKPTIYGLNRAAESYQYQIDSFDKVRGLTSGRTSDELLVVGTHNFTQGVWSVSLESGEISLVFSHQDSDITQAIFDSEKNTLYYSFHEQRTDVKEVSLTGVQSKLPQLNSTLVDKSARYSIDGDKLYFSSNRNGDFELYSYHKDSSLVRKVSSLKATSIWHYSVSEALNKVAIVYSTDHIRLGVLNATSGELINSIPLDELKFPLGWSKDGKHLYISEHLSSIAMYLYDAEKLVIKKKRTHLGLTAYELKTGEIIAFDYQSNRFVSYDFHSEQLTHLSDPVEEHLHLSPYNSSTNGEVAMLLNNNGLYKSVYRLHLSNIPRNRQRTLVANLLVSGNMQAYSPDMTSLLVVDADKNLNGNIVALQLK